MEWNFFHSLAFGVICGFGEFLPVSAEAHRRFFALFTGAGAEIAGFRLAGHIGALLALLLCCHPQLQKQRREQRLAAVPPRRRKRQPDMRTILDIRVLRTAAVPMLVGFAAYLFFPPEGYLWLLAALLALNGVLLYIPQVRRIGNKDSQHMSALESVLFGLGSALGAIPGISRIGSGTSTLQLTGVDRQAALELSLLLSVPALIALTGLDVYALFTVAGSFSLAYFFQYILVAAAAAGSAYLGIVLVRFLSVHEGFSGFSYYCWGAALLMFILYLTI